MKKLKLSVLFLLAAVTVSCAQNDSAKIMQVLNLQVERWNAGDIPGYMSGYLKDDRLEFVGGKNITYGWEATLEKYKKGYPNSEAMGKLSFDILNIRILNESYAYVTGRWKITRSKDNPEGTFTLLFQKIGDKWLIISDHSS